jgi:hypothetical protein
MKKLAFLIVILFLGFSITGLHAQEIINTTGGNASGSGGSVSYSVGQIVYTTNTGDNGTVAQGVQQAYEISNVTGLEEANNISLIVSVYPNPTTDFLILEIEGDVKTQYFVALYNMQGKLLQNKKITSHQTIIAMGNLVPAIYFLKVIKTQGHASQQEVKTFKIIKK